MESREEPPDCLYLSIILHVYGGYFLYNPDKPCIFMQVMRKRIRVYSACRNCVNSISHAHIPHIKVAHMPHKYILQVSDAEFNSECMLHIVSYTTRDA